MVDVLAQVGGRSAKPVLASTPAPSVSAEEMVRPYSEIAKAVGGLGERLEEASLPFERQAGMQSVERDVEGNIKVGNRLEFTKGDKAYNAAALQAGLAVGRTDIAQKLQELRISYDGRPDEFKKAADTYVKDVGKNGSAMLRPFLQQEAASITGQHMTGLMSSKHNTDLQRAWGALDSREKLLVEQLNGLASNGGTGTPEFQRIRTEIDDVRAQKAANPKWAYDPAQKSVADQRLDTDLRANAIVGQARRSYESHGDLGRAQKEVETALEALPMDPTDKLRFMGQVGARLQGAHAARTQERDDLRKDADLLTEAMGAGQKIDDGRFSAVRGRLASLRDHVSVAKLDIAKLNAEYEPLARYAPATQAVAALGQMRSRTAAVSAGPAGADLLRRFEGFRDAAYWDVNAFRTGYGSDTITRADGTVVKVDQASRVSRDDAERDLNRRLNDEFVPKASGAVGPGWASLPTAAKDALVSVTYNYGALPGSVAEAAKSGDLTSISAAIRGLAGHNGGINAKRRNEEADHVFAASDLASSPLFKDNVKRYQGIINDRAKGVWDGINKAINEGYQPSRQEVDDLLTFLPAVSDPDLRLKIATGMKVEIEKAKVAGRPVADVERFAAAAAEAARKGESGVVEREVATAYARSAQARRTVLNEEPVAYGRVDPAVDLPMPKPLNLSSAEAFQAGMTERMQIHGRVKAVNPEAPELITTKQDREQISAGLLQGDAGTVSTILGAMMALPPEKYAAELSSGKVRDAIGGLTRSGDPAKMRSAFEALGLLQRRNHIAFSEAFGRDMENRLERWNAQTSVKPPDVVASEIMALDDPATAKAREISREEAAKKIKTTTANDVAGYFKKSWVPFTSPGAPMGEINGVMMPNVLLGQFREEFTEAYEMVGDVTKARNLAVKRMERVWKPSAANGGALTKHAPEAYFPTIDGSHDWIKAQLDKDVDSALRPSATGATDRAQGAAGEQQRALVTDPRAGQKRMIVPDQETEQAIRLGQKPTYLVILQRGDGTHEVLRDAKNKAMRWQPNPEPIMDEKRAAFERRRQPANGAVPGIIAFPEM